MKVCSYCGKVLKEAATECPSCGALEFKYKCEKCGTVYEKGRCPVCNGKLGKQADIRREEEKTAAGTNEIGYISGGKQDNSEKAQRKPDVSGEVCKKPNISGEVGKKPNDSAASVKRSSKKKKSWKASLLQIGIFLVCVFFIVKLYRNHTSDWRMCVQDGHPTIYDDYSEAEEFWEGNGKAAVVTKYETHDYKDAVVLLVSSQTEKPHWKINRVSLNFTESKGKEKIVLKDMLEVVRSYIPRDIVDNYYSYQTSFVETYGMRDYEDYHYVWKLNDAGMEQKQNGRTEFEEKFGFHISHIGSYWHIYLDSADSTIQGNTNRQEDKKYKKESWNVEL